MTHEELQIRACCVQAHHLVAMTFNQCNIRLRGRTAEAASLLARRMAFELVMADAAFPIGLSEAQAVPPELVAEITHLVRRARTSHARMPNVVSSSVH